MQNETLNCEQARLKMAAYLEGEACFSLEAHLAGCETCLAACMEQALGRPAPVRVPTGFRERLLEQLPATPPAEGHIDRWALVAAGLFAGIGTALWFSGEFTYLAGLAVETLAQPAILISAAGIEAFLAFAWLRRAASREF